MKVKLDMKKFIRKSLLSAMIAVAISVHTLAFAQVGESKDPAPTQNTAETLTRAILQTTNAVHSTTKDLLKTTRAISAIVALGGMLSGLSSPLTAAAGALNVLSSSVLNALYIIDIATGKSFRSDSDFYDNLNSGFAVLSILHNRGKPAFNFDRASAQTTAATSEVPNKPDFPASENTTLATPIQQRNHSASAK